MFLPDLVLQQRATYSRCSRREGKGLEKVDGYGGLEFERGQEQQNAYSRRLLGHQRTINQMRLKLSSPSRGT